MRRITRLIIVFVALALVMAGPLSLMPGGASVVPMREASAAYPGANGKIAFVSNRDGPLDIFVMDSDGSDQINITSHVRSDFSPSWSPDGTKIAFRSDRENLGGRADIYVMDADGSNVTRLTHTALFANYPTWSPDGSKIAFVNRVSEPQIGVPNPFQIFVMNADGSNLTQLTSDSAHKQDLSWSPDGSKIAFSGNPDNVSGPSNLDIFVIDADGSNRVNLTSHPSQEMHPDWSPDGTRIAFVRVQDVNVFDIWVIDADGGNPTNLTNYPTSDRQPAWSPDGRYIAFASPRNGMNIFVMDADGSNLRQITNDGLNQMPSWQPLHEKCALLLVPGIAGTYAAATQHDVLWLLNRGVHPDQLQIDPMGRVYHDLITTLENVGYNQGEDFFVVNYDWRLPPAPFDGTIDGQISGLTGASITNATFEHSVDYLGHYLRQAVEAHEENAPGSELDCVDVIAHSTGGLVTRSYIQSTAYQDSFMSANGERNLPRVNEFIMLGVPNRGASKAWNPLHDNWVIDPAYQVVLSKIVYRAWLKVTLWDAPIHGPDHTITRASITNAAGEHDPMLFIEQYVPTIGALLATYDFLDTGSGFSSVNSDPNRRNNLLLDLNDGFDFTGTADPSPFASLSTVTAIYGTDQPTATGVIERIGPDSDGKGILPFSDFLARSPEPGEVWYQDIQPPVSGDGTVPIDSAAGQFFGDERVTLIPLSAATTTGKTDHNGLVGNPDVQATVLDILGRTVEPGDIVTGKGTAFLVALSVIFDPVEGFVVDGNGNRLGYSSATGAVAEIPGSLWVGNSDGFGLVDGPVVEPLTLELSGLGEHHVVVVSIADGERFGGAFSEGFLELGEEITVPVAIGDEPGDDPGEPEDPDEPANPDDEPTADEFLQELIDLLTAMDIHAGIKQSRLAQLGAVQASLEREDEETVCNQLQAFINGVNAQRSKHLSEEQADELLDRAEQIREALDC